MPFEGCGGFDGGQDERLMTTMPDACLKWLDIQEKMMLEVLNSSTFPGSRIEVTNIQQPYNFEDPTFEKQLPPAAKEVMAKALIFTRFFLKNDLF